MIINKAFIWTNDMLYRFTRRLPAGTCRAVVFLCCLLLDAIFFFNIGYFENARYTMLYGSAVTAIMAIFCIEGNAKSVVWNRLTCIPLGLFAIGIIVISFLHPIGAGYVVFALDILLIYSFLYFVLVNGKGIKHLSRALAISAAVEGIIAYIYCTWLSFHGTLGLWGARVMGHTTNPNFLGALGLVMLTTAMYLLMKGSETAVVDILAALSLGCGTYFMIGSASRTAMLSAIGCILSAAVFIVKKRATGKQQRKDLKRMLAILVAAAVSFGFGMKMNDINYHYAEKNMLDTPQYDQQEETSKNGNEADELQRRLNTERDINTFTSGRTVVWKVYISNFSMTGKKVSEIEDQFNGLEEWRAHNNIIDYIYRLGYVVGSFYAVFYVAVSLLGLIILFSKKHRSAEAFLLVEFIGCYALYAMIEVATLPFIRCVPCMFFILSAPIMIKDANRKVSR